MTKIGELGEQIVAQWLESQEYCILHHRWHCRWGEIDIIAQNQSLATLVFLEVKTRSLNNWDEGGALAINRRKQQKLWQTAALFLSENVHLANFACRFDVALVSYVSLKQKQTLLNDIALAQGVDKPQFTAAGYQFTIQAYYQSAFDLSDF